MTSRQDNNKQWAEWFDYSATLEQRVAQSMRRSEVAKSQSYSDLCSKLDKCLEILESLAPTTTALIVPSKEEIRKYGQNK